MNKPSNLRKCDGKKTKSDVRTGIELFFVSLGYSVNDKCLEKMYIYVRTLLEVR